MDSDTPDTLVLPEIEEKTRTTHQPRYNVVLLDDDFHTYEYVILMLVKLFRFSEEHAFRCAREVDRAGRVILLTTSKEHAELKQDQIHSYGADPLLSESSGSMTAIVEPVE